MISIATRCCGMPSKLWECKNRYQPSQECPDIWTGFTTSRKVKAWVENPNDSLQYVYAGWPWWSCIWVRLTQIGEFPRPVGCFCQPNRRVEHPKSKSTQPRCATTMVTLIYTISSSEVKRCYNDYIYFIILDETQRLLDSAVEDNLIKLENKIGTKGTKSGIEEKAYRLPTLDMLPRERHDW